VPKIAFSAPGFQIWSDGMVVVAVDPSAPTEAASQTQARTEWVLRRANPLNREFILGEVAKDPTIEVDCCALQQALQLSAPQKDVLRWCFYAKPLSGLIAEQPPSLSPYQAVVEALKQEVLDQHEWLSIDDLRMLVRCAAMEVKRRMPEALDLSSLMEQLLRIATADLRGYFDGRTQINDPWLTGEMGSIEMHATERLSMAQGEALPVLVKVWARRLDVLLTRAICEVQRSDEERHRLMNEIRPAYERLLSECFVLGEKEPQNAHSALQHYVRCVLDKLGFPEVPIMGMPSFQQMQIAREFAERLNPSVLPSEKPTPPPANWAPIDESRQQARTGELHMVAAARELLKGELELQQGLRCLQHAYNNGWYYWLKLHHPTAPLIKLRLTLAQASKPQELDSIDDIVAPDGWAMQRLRLLPAQLQALMPALEADLDLAIVFKGPTDLIYGDTRTDEIHHYTALIRANGMHFELDSVAADAQSGKRWVPNLKDYFERFQGGAYMAIRGGPDHPLSKYVALISIEPFWRTCEALGVFLGRQPIMELAQFLPLDRMQDEARALRAKSAAEFCKSGGFPRAASYDKWLPRDGDRTQDIMQWLATLGVKQGILWTGTDPLVVAVKRSSSGPWIAYTFDRSGQVRRRYLAKLLEGQNSYFKKLSVSDRQARAGFVQFLTLGPPDADASLLGHVQSSVQPVLSRRPAAQADALPDSDGSEDYSGASKETQQAATLAKQPRPSKKRRAEQVVDYSASFPSS
jgi:hypothetical protein